MRWTLIYPSCFFSVLSLIAIIVLLSNDMAWSNDVGTIGLYQVHFAVGLRGWSFEFNCRQEECPTPDSKETADYQSSSCRWHFCEPCGKATKHINAMLNACIAFIAIYFVLAVGRVNLRNRGGFFGKIIAVFSSVLNFVTLVAAWSLWLDRCNNKFDDMNYMIGEIRVINIKPQLYYGFVVAVLASTSAVLCVIAEAIMQSKLQSVAANPRLTEEIMRKSPYFVL
uniref:Uncharacterized protein n=1 Tax=Lotharella oceanica TaxID=641309 RepID=A0A7S2TKV5_9EUKA|mmetsp:Transcript_18500/g.34913  ORF Transcript_18500/g.34913 Transcript_18500/m.34913 type:complete len:225 (+) Transcript_18500:170-844(+)